MPDSRLEGRERELEILQVEDEIADRRRAIAEKKALERAAKRQYGRNWRKVIGSIKPNPEAIQSLYASNPELRELNRPNRLRRM